MKSPILYHWAFFMPHLFSWKNNMGFESVTILLPSTRKNLKGIYLLGFQLEGEFILSDERSIKYRLYKPSI